jgi:Fuc2NAc and GlcNAc transferase
VKLIVIYLLIGIISFILTYIVRKIAINKKVIDIPNERSSHSVPTPRGGGLAIVISWYIGITLLFLLKQIELNLFLALLSGIILAFISIIDDVVSLNPIIRLVAQTLSAVFAIYFIGSLNFFFFNNNIYLINILTFFLTLISIVWFINVYNFLDGIDAYASLETIFVAGSIYLFTGSNVVLLLVISVVGYLYWNWPKAKIFMGDVGSTQLGFILIIFGIYFHNNQQIEISVWVILTSLFWFDASFTLIRRFLNKEKLSQAHRKHAYQRIVLSGFSHSKTNLYAFIVNLLLLLIGYLVSLNTIFTIPGFFATFVLLYLIERRIEYLFPFKK